MGVVFAGLPVVPQQRSDAPGPKVHVNVVQRHLHIALRVWRVRILLRLRPKCTQVQGTRSMQQQVKAAQPPIGCQ